MEYDISVIDKPDAPKKQLKTADKKAYHREYMAKYRASEEAYDVCKQCLERYRKSAVKVHLASKKHKKAVEISEQFLKMFESTP
jgi:beta-phosphoglucomutase-like phosphatase (HAD superfamily)